MSPETSCRTWTSPVIGEYGVMDPRIFGTDPMNLEAELLNLSLPERATYDAERNILFLNFEGMYVRVAEDVQAIWDICEQRCRAAGKRVGAVINYDRFRINQEMYDAYAEMDRYFLAHYFANITRTRPAPFCAPSWAKRSRDATSHRIYSSAKEEAQAFLATLGRESEKEA
jgi:propionate CoA-transferase